MRCTTHHQNSLSNARSPDRLARLCPSMCPSLTHTPAQRARSDTHACPPTYKRLALASGSPRAVGTDKVGLVHRASSIEGVACDGAFSSFELRRSVCTGVESVFCVFFFFLSSKGVVVCFFFFLVVFIQVFTGLIVSSRSRCRVAGLNSDESAKQSRAVTE